MHIAHYIRATQKTMEYQALEIKELKKQLNSNIKTIRKLKPIITQLGRL